MVTCTCADCKLEGKYLAVIMHTEMIYMHETLTGTGMHLNLWYFVQSFNSCAELFQLVLPDLNRN